MRDLALLTTRLVLGGYMIAHGSQKAFGALGGPGLDNAGAGFEMMGLKPGKQMATLAAVSEITGGVLTATGLANPAGPVLIGSAMATASMVHKPAGPMGANGGYEQTLTNLAAAVTLATAGPGKYKLGAALPNRVAAVFAIGATAISAYTALQIVKGQKAAAGASPDAEDIGSDTTVDVTNETTASETAITNA